MFETKQLNEYLRSISVIETDVMKRLREETSTMENSRMQISPEEGKLLYFLAKLISARRTLEIGVFTGYSSLWTAMALPPGGMITACDISEEWTAMARKYWKEAGVFGSIDLRLGPAVDTLDGLIQDGLAESYDLAFIDADKDMYPEYYSRCLELVRSGGLIVMDNVLMGGGVFDPDNQRDAVETVRELNRNISVDDRVEVSMLPMRDGISLILKK